MVSLDQPTDHVDDLVNLFRGLRVDRRRQRVQRLNFFHPGRDQPLSQVVGGDALLVGAVDDLVVDVGEVLRVPDGVSQVLEIPPDHVKGDGRHAMTDVRMVIDGNAADVHPHDVRLDGLEWLLATRHGVVNVETGLGLRSSRIGGMLKFGHGCLSFGLESS